MSTSINMHCVSRVEVDQTTDFSVPGRSLYVRRILLVSEDGDEMDITLFSDSTAKLRVCYKNGPEPV